MSSDLKGAGGGGGGSEGSQKRPFEVLTDVNNVHGWVVEDCCAVTYRPNGEQWVDAKAMMPNVPDDLAGERELDLGVVELLDVGALGEGGWHHLGLDDGDAGLPHSVAAGHLGVHLLNCAVHGQVPVLLVHVVVARPRLVSNPNAEVLDAGGAAVKDLHNKLHSTVEPVQNACVAAGLSSGRGLLVGSRARVWHEDMPGPWIAHIAQRCNERELTMTAPRQKALAAGADASHSCR